MANNPQIKEQSTYVIGRHNEKYGYDVTNPTFIRLESVVKTGAQLHQLGVRRVSDIATANLSPHFKAGKPYQVYMQEVYDGMPVNKWIATVILEEAKAPTYAPQTFVYSGLNDAEPTQNTAIEMQLRRKIEMLESKNENLLEQIEQVRRDREQESIRLQNIYEQNTANATEHLQQHVEHLNGQIEKLEAEIEKYIKANTKLTIERDTYKLSLDNVQYMERARKNAEKAVEQAEKQAEARVRKEIQQQGLNDNSGISSLVDFVKYIAPIAIQQFMKPNSAPSPEVVRQTLNGLEKLAASEEPQPIVEDDSPQFIQHVPVGAEQGGIVPNLPYGRNVVPPPPITMPQPQRVIIGG